MSAGPGDWWAETAAASPDGRVLYLGVGEGAHAGLLAPHAGELIAVDEDRRRIARFKGRARAEGWSNVRFITSPPHAVELREEFGLIIVPASLINGVEDPAVRGGIVKRAAAHCREDGKVLLRLLNPHWLASGMPVSENETDVRLEHLDGDAWEQRHRARLIRTADDGDEQAEIVEVTALYPRELRALAYQSGLDVVATWGDEPGESMLGVGGAAWHLLCEPAT